MSLLYQHGNLSFKSKATLCKEGLLSRLVAAELLDWKLACTPSASVSACVKRKDSVWQPGPLRNM